MKNTLSNPVRITASQLVVGDRLPGSLVTLVVTAIDNAFDPFVRVTMAHPEDSSITRVELWHGATGVYVEKVAR